MVGEARLLLNNPSGVSLDMLEANGIVLRWIVLGLNLYVPRSSSGRHVSVQAVKYPIAHSPASGQAREPAQVTERALHSSQIKLIILSF